jgi:hypothetical protein
MAPGTKGRTRCPDQILTCFCTVLNLPVYLHTYHELAAAEDSTLKKLTFYTIVLFQPSISFVYSTYQNSTASKLTLLYY